MPKSINLYAAKTSLPSDVGDAFAGEFDLVVADGAPRKEFQLLKNYCTISSSFIHGPKGMKMTLLRFAALPVVLSMLEITLALASDTIEKPTLHVNDTWVYQYMDGFTNDVLYKTSMRIIQMDNGEVVVRNERTDKDGSKNWLVYYDESWRLRDNGNFAYDPAGNGLSFPIEMGGELNSEYRSTNLKTGELFNCSIKGKALGSEKVTVVAGTFDAAHLQYDNECVGANKSITNAHIDTWYVPSVNRFVQEIFTSTSNGRVRSKFIDQLVQYAPAK